MTDLPLLPTTVVGSHARPAWWHACKDLVEEDRWGPADLEELLKQWRRMGYQFEASVYTPGVVSRRGGYPGPLV